MDQERLRRISAGFRQMEEAFAKLTTATQRLHFVLLDQIPDEDRTPRSWEVEREEFMRRQGPSLT